MKGEPPTKKTKFNSGLFGIIRLHEILEDCNSHSRNCFLISNEVGQSMRGCNLVSLRSYRGAVNSFYREIESKLSNDERKYYKKILEAAKKIGGIIELQKTQEGAIERIHKGRFQKHWSLIEYAEIKLRRYANKYGLLIPDQESETGGADL